MGAFNILTTKIPCPDCGKEHEGRIQFKYGSTWQFEYQIGDALTWGGNNFGSPDLKKVKAYGIIESTICPFCRKSNIVEEFDVFIEDSIIVRVTPMVSIGCYLGDGNSEFVVPNT